MSSAYDLCEIDDVVAWLTPAPPDADLPLLDRLITAASDFVLRYLNRYILSADYIETRDGTGGRVLLFANFPVTSVTQVNIDNIDIQPSTNPTVAGYAFSPTELILRGNIFWRGKQNVLIRYTAGYIEIPPEITQATIELVVERYRERGREGVAQENVVGISSTTFKPTDITLSIKAGLQPYRAVAPIQAISQRFANPPSPPI